MRWKSDIAHHSPTVTLLAIIQFKNKCVVCWQKTRFLYFLKSQPGNKLLSLGLGNVHHIYGNRSYVVFRELWLPLVYDLPVSLSGCYNERRVRLLSFLSFSYMSAYFSSHVHKFANNFQSTTNSQLRFCQKQIESFLGKVMKS